MVKKNINFSKFPKDLESKLAYNLETKREAFPVGWYLRN